MSAADSDSQKRERCPPIAPPRFGVRALLITVTVVAVLICLLQQLGILGAMAAFGMAVLFSIYSTVRGRTSERQMAFDLIWGVVLPVLCLTFDPVLFQPDPSIAMTVSLPTPENIQLTSVAVLAYLTLGFQMLILMVWICVGHRLRRGAALMAGLLGTGFVLAMTIAISIPLGAIYTIVLMFDNLDELFDRFQFMGAKTTIAILGVTPLFTARVFYRRARQAQQSACVALEPRRIRVIAIVGMLTAVVVPILLLLSVRGPSALADMFP